MGVDVGLRLPTSGPSNHHCLHLQPTESMPSDIHATDDTGQARPVPGGPCALPLHERWVPEERVVGATTSTPYVSLTSRARLWTTRRPQARLHLHVPLHRLRRMILHRPMAEWHCRFFTPSAFRFYGGGDGDRRLAGVVEPELRRGALAHVQFGIAALAPAAVHATASRHYSVPFVVFARCLSLSCFRSLLVVIACQTYILGQ